MLLSVYVYEQTCLNQFRTNKGVNSFAVSASIATRLFRHILPATRTRSSPPTSCSISPMMRIHPPPSKESTKPRSFVCLPRLAVGYRWSREEGLIRAHGC